MENYIPFLLMYVVYKIFIDKKKAKKKSPQKPIVFKENGENSFPFEPIVPEVPKQGQDFFQEPKRKEVQHIDSSDFQKEEKVQTQNRIQEKEEEKKEEYSSENKTFIPLLKDADTLRNYFIFSQVINEPKFKE